MGTDYPPPSQERACLRCMWWQRTNSVVGHCKRMPPARPDGESAGAWPMTGRGDWCGEFKPDSGDGKSW